MHIHLDPVGGIAGDMFVAALLDAFPELEEHLLAFFGTPPLARLVRVRRVPRADGVLAGSGFEVEPVEPAPPPRTPGAPPPEPGHHRHHHHHEHPPPPGRPPGEDAHGPEPHAHRAWADIRAWLEGGTAAGWLPEGVARRATDIFERLAEAEGSVHGVDPGSVTFHEVGAWDSIADVLAAAWLVDALARGHAELTWSTSALPLGGGRVRTAHGLLPVPAPATARLLRGLPCHDDGIAGERVTPTGAAILRHLDPSVRWPEPRGTGAAGDGGGERMEGGRVRGRQAGGTPGRLTRDGHGLGTRRLPGVSNVLRVLVFEAPADEPGQEPGETVVEPVGVAAFELDDQSPEDIATALERLRRLPGVLDVAQGTVVGKKGRLGVRIQVLFEPPAEDRVVRACFTETTTLGVRVHGERRYVLPRETATRETGAGAVRVKWARRPDGTRTVKAEMDDLAGAPGGAWGRRRARLEAERDEDGPRGSGQGEGENGP